MVRRSQNLAYFRTVTLIPPLEDSLVFTIMLVLARRSWRQFGLPSLLHTLVRDATIYFLVIFSAHFILTMTILFGRVGSTTYLVNHSQANKFLQRYVQLLPGP